MQVSTGALHAGALSHGRHLHAEGVGPFKFKSPGRAHGCAQVLVIVTVPTFSCCRAVAAWAPAPGSATATAASKVQKTRRPGIPML